MSHNGINKTFIIESIYSTGSSETYSACTTLYSNKLISCSGDTSIELGTTNITFSGNLYSGGTSLLDIFQISGATLWVASSGDTSVVKANSNNAAGNHSVAGGKNNISGGYAGFIGGGEYNEIYPNATYGAIVAGSGNTIYNMPPPPPPEPGRLLATIIM